jgi:hypothetical protein
MTREELVALCERGIVHQRKWCNRDSASAQSQLGECWALLKAGCDFDVCTRANQPSQASCVTDDRTIWVEITVPGFSRFEGGVMDVETFYIPTEARLSQVGPGEDWY